MKRVLIFSTAYFPHVGGAEVAIREITNRLSGEYECDLICARYDAHLPSRERIDAVNVYRVGIGVRIIDKILSPFWGALLTLSLERKCRYDLYWAMMATYGSGGAYIARWFTKKPIVLTLQEGDPPEYLRTKWFGLVGLAWQLALSQSQAVTVISSYLGKLAKEFGYTGDPVLVPNGVDTDSFGSVVPVRHDGVRLVTTSRLVHKNAVDDVIRALTFLPEMVSFVVYGTGPDEKKLKKLVHTLSVESRVRFMGHLPYQKLPHALAESDIFVRPSRSEGMGNSFIEAMAAGLPVIATQEGGIADFLFDAKRNPDKETTGWAVDANAPEQIAEAVKDILAHPDIVRKVIDSARRLVIEKYDWNLIAKQMKVPLDQTFRRR